MPESISKTKLKKDNSNSFSKMRDVTWPLRNKLQKHFVSICIEVQT